MPTDFDSLNISSIAIQLEAAFRCRPRPNKKTDSNELTEDELTSLNEIWKFKWDEIPVYVWECHADVLSWLSPLAFCYYLPGALLHALDNGDFDGLVASRIGAALDRTPEFDVWDDFFIERWGSLTLNELEAIEAWLQWFCEWVSSFDEISLIRMMLTIGVLKERSRPA